MVNDLISHAATILPVKDVPASIRYYTEQLGFKLTFSWEEPATYAVLKAGENVSIHLSQIERKQSPSGQHVAIYTFVHDVDKLYEIYQEREVFIHNEICDQDYGMRDFDIRDPDGHILSFGKHVEA